MRRFIPILKVVTLLVIAPIVIYSASLSKTVRLWQEYQNLERNVRDAPTDTSSGEVRASAPLLSTGGILGSVMSSCSSADVSVVSYSPEMEATATGMGLCRAELILSGRFCPLLTVMDSISNLSQIKTASAEFKCDERMRKENRIQLRLELVQLELLTGDQKTTE